MDYYHSLVTQKSFEELIHLQKLIPFVLIGGWAVYFYTKALKSKDIDIIVDYPVLSILRKEYSLNKNDRLKKYHAVKDEVEIDIYLPYFSVLGIPVEDLIKHTRIVEGFTVLEKNYLFVLKIYTLAQRGRTPKGRKDFLDIISLYRSGINLVGITQIISKYKLTKEMDIFREFLSETTSIVELNINSHYFSKFKKNILAVF